MKKLFFLFLLTLGEFLLGFPPKARAGTDVYDPMNVWDKKMWKEVRNAQLSNPLLPCMDEQEAAFWKFGNRGAGMRIKGKPCVATLANLKLDLFYHPQYMAGMNYTIWQEESARGAFSFRWIDANNHYDLEIEHTSMRVVKYVNGQRYVLSKTPIPGVRVYSVYGNVMVFVNSDRTIRVHTSMTDYIVQDSPPYLRGGTIALSVSNFDGLLSETLYKSVGVNTWEDDIALKVPYFSQRDPEWASAEYDSAQKWSKDPTIKRWGCALTSLAGLLKYHKFSKLPDGKPMNPLNLNAWLKAQADGYIGQGLVNWQSIVRLTKILSPTLHTPSLSYEKAQYSLLAARDEYLQNRPVIVELPGHFVTGIGRSREYGVINDPDNIQNQFLQDLNKKDPLSMRLFKPTTKRTGAFVAALPKDLEATLTIAGKNIPYSLSNQLGPEQEVSKIFEATSLNQGDKIVFTVKNPVSRTPRRISVFTYNAAGDVVENSLLVPADKPMQLSSTFQLESGAMQIQ